MPNSWPTSPWDRINMLRQCVLEWFVMLTWVTRTQHILKEPWSLRSYIEIIQCALPLDSLNESEFVHVASRTIIYQVPPPQGLLTLKFQRSRIKTIYTIKMKPKELVHHKMSDIQKFKLPFIFCWLHRHFPLWLPHGKLLNVAKVLSLASKQ